MHPCRKTRVVQAAWVVLAETNPISIPLGSVYAHRVAVAQLSLLFSYSNLIIVLKPSPWGCA